MAGHLLLPYSSQTILHPLCSPQEIEDPQIMNHTFGGKHLDSDYNVNRSKETVLSSTTIDKSIDVRTHFSYNQREKDFLLPNVSILNKPLGCAYKDQLECPLSVGDRKTLSVQFLLFQYFTGRSLHEDYVEWSEMVSAEPTLCLPHWTF